MKIAAYKHFPNATELGMGNTNETYILVGSSYDLSEMFPNGVDVNVYDSESNRSFVLRSRISNKEFRINQLGALYRAYDLLPGDEIEFTHIISDNCDKVFFRVSKNNRVYISISTKGAEILNVERLLPFKLRNLLQCYDIPISEGILKIVFYKRDKKRSDSPSETDFYKVSLNGFEIPKGQFFLEIGERNSFSDIEKSHYCEFSISETFSSDLFSSLVTIQDREDLPLQQIFYGAPGTGKSHTVDDVAKVYKHQRITFHPDSDYSSFVGCYKPVMSDEDKDKIIYSFTPQAFTNAYIEAWELNAKKEPVFLVIEEINRGNCAQIFGDLFQLLDRKDDGYSKYEITPDTELQRHIAKQGLSVSGILDSDGKDISDKINSGELMKLPNNLHIWATMNTSDQSLFPIDSAFKRRWDWVYVPIEDGVDKDTNQKLDWQIEVDENHKPVSWWLFLQKINMIIADLTSSEDKQLGYFFCKPDKEDKKTISKERFVGKVLFYLWNDIFKDYAFDLDICKKAKDNKKVQYFANFYKKQNVIDIDALINFFEKLDSSQKEIDDKEVIIFTKKSADSAPEPVPTAPEE